MDQLELGDIAARRTDEIPFGRRKEVAIARAIAGAPSVLLLDEPAAGLDDHEASELAELIRRLAHERGIAVLLVEHKIDMIMSISDRVSVLVGGSILTSGTPDEVRSDPAVLDAYLGRSAGASREVTAGASA
jgi:sulfate-transporting ATPase